MELPINVKGLNTRPTSDCVSRSNSFFYVWYGLYFQLALLIENALPLVVKLN